jgi:hypothetical protein
MRKKLKRMNKDWERDPEFSDLSPESNSGISGIHGTNFESIQRTNSVS